MCNPRRNQGNEHLWQLQRFLLFGLDLCSDVCSKRRGGAGVAAPQADLYMGDGPRGGLGHWAPLRLTNELYIYIYIIYHI